MVDVKSVDQRDDMIYMNTTTYVKVKRNIWSTSQESEFYNVTKV